MKIKNKIAWQKEYKFSFACENASQNGYTTEKILDALQANTVPIYWGNPLIEVDFSSKCFINAMDFSSNTELVEYIKYIDENDEEYLKILNAPWQPVSLTPHSDTEFYPPLVEDEKFTQFLFHIFDQDLTLARRVSLYGVGHHVNKTYTRIVVLYTMFRQTQNILLRPFYALRNALRKIRKN